MSHASSCHLLCNHHNQHQLKPKLFHRHRKTIFQQLMIVIKVITSLLIQYHIITMKLTTWLINNRLKTIHTLLLQILLIIKTQVIYQTCLMIIAFTGIIHLICIQTWAFITTKMHLITLTIVCYNNLIKVIRAMINYKILIFLFQLLT